MGATSHVEVDTRRRYRPRENVERHVADLTRIPGIATEIPSAEGEVDLGRRSARPAHHRRRPLLPELVAVAVEEDVHLLRDRLRCEELGVCAPEDGLGPTRAEFEQTRQPSLRVRQEQVVLGRVGAVVVVEARIHASELGQAHWHISVVENDRYPKPVAERRGYAAEMRHRDREEHNGIGPLTLDEPLEMATPTRRDDAPDRLARDPVEPRLLRLVLGAPQVPVALEPCETASDGRIGLALAIGGVRSGTPPRRLDGPPTVGRDHEIDSGLVHPLPELPPGRSAAVAEVEVDCGCNGKNPRRLHGCKSSGLSHNARREMIVAGQPTPC